MRNLFLSFLVLLFAIGANAQKMRIWSNGQIEYQKSITRIDSITFVDESTPDPTLPAYRTSYLEYNDLMPLFMISIAQAEAKLSAMGFQGGWRTYLDDDGKNREDFLYTSPSYKDTIFLYQDIEGFVTSIMYQASKGVIPYEAKSWLAHLPQTIPLPEKLVEISNIQSISFSSGSSRGTKDVDCSTYAEYTNMLNGLMSGMAVGAIWGAPMAPNYYPTGYYGGIIMQYEYKNNIDCAHLYITSFYHEQKIIEPDIP